MRAVLGDGLLRLLYDGMRCASNFSLECGARLYGDEEVSSE